ncbi:MAG: S10 family peptidase [Methylovirgula sp.]
MIGAAKSFTLALALLIAGALPLAAQEAGKHAAPTAVPSADTNPPHPLPPASTTTHVLKIGDRTINFAAKAGAIRLSDANTGTPLADVAYIAFLKDGEDAAKRPITFAVNGGPGAGSAWLDLGALGPWRLPLEGGKLPPSASPATVPNAETWLDFTDLVFIDPPDTGYSRVLDKDARKTFFSVDGDINALSVAIRKWLTENHRLESPKFIVGESYGGFRAPKLARRLTDAEGIGINGIVMLSPVLDFGWFNSTNNPLTFATHLPSMTAAARDVTGPETREKLADVEAYAAGPYIVDLLRGDSDAAALDRISTKVAGFTGLDPTLVRKLGGRIDIRTFARERDRAAGRVASAYDALVTGYDPEPHTARGDYADPVLDALKTPLASAIADIAANQLKWFVDARYEILNEKVNEGWDWGHGTAEAMSDLKQDLALDPKFRVLVAHGVTDLVTPYFTSKLLLDQIAPMGEPSRVHLSVYGGGHMFYARDASRAALHDDARKLIEAN